MKFYRWFFVFFVLAVSASAQTPHPELNQVLPGIDVLAARNFDILRGKKIGLVTNQTGRARDGRATIDILRRAPGVKLMALYAPEHGVRGEIAAGAHVKTYRDKITGLPVYSLYGSTRRPTSSMLRGVQVLVFDIQDIGARSYTFIATLGECLTACAQRKIPLVVLDRPNPIGNAIEGNIAQDFSFVCPFPIPYRHGLTMGEMARWINAKRGGKAKLTVVPMQGYQRRFVWDDTGLPWMKTSPNIPRSTSPFFYATTGLIGELPALSIGIGTPWQFEVAGAPGINADALQQELQKRDLPGVEFRAASWIPAKGRYAKQLCSGVQIILHEPQRLQLTRLNFEIYDAVRRVAPQIKFWNSAERNSMFDKVCGTPQMRRLMQSGKSSSEVWKVWNSGAARFANETQAVRLYQD